MKYMRKQLGAVWLMLALLCCLAACGGGAEATPTPAPTASPSPTEPADTAPAPLHILLGYQEDSRWEEGTVLSRAEWDSLLLGEESRAAFPALDRRLRELHDNQQHENQQFVQDMLSDARELAAIQGELFGGLTRRTAYLVQRADERILSVQVNGSEYTGGVHPNYGVYGLNLDPATGQPLALTDVLTDVTGLSDRLTRKLQEKYDMEGFFNPSEPLADYTPDRYSWTLDHQGITFYFSPYELATYAAGLLTVTLWFDEQPELFEPRYTVAGGWARRLPLHSEVEVDLNGGGEQKDRLFLRMEEQETGTLQLYVARNGQEQLLEECYGFVMQPLLVCLGEPDSRRYFLYVEAAGENDYTSIWVYDLNGADITLSGTCSGAGLPGIYLENEGEAGIWYETVFTDPTRFVLDSRIQILGSWTGSRVYTAHPETGIIQPQTAYYTLPDDSLPIVSAVELSVTMLPGQEEEQIPAGTRFYFRRTDGETYAEMLLEDGRECRIELEYEDWTPRINGIPEWDCFVDVLYAD